jgi:glyoxylase-like metal-dependent hydrolase (beta-lactamase superfamily II)
MRKNHQNRLVVMITAAIACGAAPGLARQASPPIVPDLARLASGAGGRAFNRTVTAAREGDRTVVRLNARVGDGGVLLEGVQLGDGVIDVELQGKDVAQQSFLGIAFHVVDWTTLEAVYFRPFNFRAPDAERRSHAVQYVSHPADTWQRLRAERPGQFEHAIDPPPAPNDWFRARIVLAKSRVEVFVNGATTPCLSVEDLGSQPSGGVALFVGNGSDGAFANLTITPTGPAGPPPASTQTVFQAAATGNLARLRALVEADAQLVSTRNPTGITALHFAALYGQRDCAEYLIDKGADPNVDSRHSGTPLDVAYESRQAAFVAWLQARGGRFTPLRFDVTPIGPHTRRIAFPWGMLNNVVVFAGSDGAVVVDSGFSVRAIDDLRTAIAGPGKLAVRYVINSHGHGDHVAGNALAPSPEAVITAASLVAAAGGPALVRDAQPLEGRSGRTLPPPYTWRTGDLELKIIPRPGLHSDADLIVYAPAEAVVAMGDLLLSESVPAVEDIGGYLAFLDDVLDVFPAHVTFVSGHGRDLDAAGLKAYREALAAMVQVIRTNLAAGRTVEQMMQDDVLKAYNAQYSLLEFLLPKTLVPRVVTGIQRGTLKH